MRRSYHTLDTQTSAREEELTSFLRKNGQQLLPMVDLITQSRMAINELIDSVGRAMLETLLEISAEQVAGARQPGKVRDQAVLWYGRQPGRVYLGDRKLAVERPRLRRRGRGRHKEVGVPAYAALQNREAMQKRMLDIVMNGVSTRHYKHVIPAMAESVGISKSSVSRETIEGSEAALKELLERRLDDKDFLVIYIDGLHCGEHCVIGAVGVDMEGGKRVLGIQEGATENSAACRDLLQNLVERGLNPELERLFVIDGSKALRGQRDPGGVWRKSGGATMPPAQAAQRGGALAARTTSANSLPDPRGLEAGRQRGHGTASQAGGVAAGRLSRCCWQFAGGNGGMLYHQSAEHSVFAAPLLGDHQLDREFAVGSADANAPCLPLAGYDASALGGRSLPGDGTQLPPHHGLQRSLGFESDLAWRERHARECEAGGVKCLSPPPTFN